MIGIDGSYLFSLEIGTELNFIDVNDNFIFSIREFAGGILPEFTLSFISANKKLVKLLHEGTLIKAKIGRTTNSLKDMNLYCTFSDSTERGNSLRAYVVKGFAVSIDFIRSPKLASYANQSAISAVIECAKKNFKTVESNILVSKDSQNWLQPNITDKNFINKTIYRADLSPSFPAIAITLDGKFILKDIKKDLNDRTVKWKFRHKTSNPNDRKEVIYLSDAPISSNSGIINALIGYDFDFKSFVTETEEKIISTITREKLLATTNKVGGSTTANKKKESGIEQSKNVHANYQLSYNSNISSLLNLSRVEVPITIIGDYFDVSPLDKCSLFTPNQDSNGSSNDEVSGTYYCTYINRQIDLKQMTTTIKLNRESVNGVV